MFTFFLSFDRVFDTQMLQNGVILFLHSRASCLCRKDFSTSQSYIFFCFCPSPRVGAGTRASPTCPA